MAGLHINKGLFNGTGKPGSIQGITAEWEGCTKCELSKTRTNVCVGSGAVPAIVMVIAKAPGWKEDKTGNVFVGKLGLEMKAWVHSSIRSEHIYWTNLLGCRIPPREGYGDQYRASQGKACINRVKALIEAVDPAIILTLGREAPNTLFGTSRSVDMLRQDIHRYHGRAVVSTINPAYITRQRGKGVPVKVIRAMEQTLADDILKLSELYQDVLGRRNAPRKP